MPQQPPPPQGEPPRNNMPEEELKVSIPRHRKQQDSSSMRQPQSDQMGEVNMQPWGDAAAAEAAESSFNSEAQDLENAVGLIHSDDQIE